MDKTLIISFLLVSVCASYAFGLECFVCNSEDDGEACTLMGEDWTGDGIPVESCEEKRENKTGVAVCGKTITTYKLPADVDVTEDGSEPKTRIIASRYCDYLRKDAKTNHCEELYGGTTSTASCVCDEDRCNGSPAFSASLITTLLVAVVAAFRQ